MKGAWGYLLLVGLTAALTLGAAHSCTERRSRRFLAEAAGARAERDSTAARAAALVTLADSLGRFGAQQLARADALARARDADRSAQRATRARLDSLERILPGRQLVADVRDTLISAQRQVIAQLEADTASLRGENGTLRASLAAELQARAALTAANDSLRSALQRAETRAGDLERLLARRPGDHCLINWPFCVTFTVGPTVTRRGVDAGGTLGIPIG